jgi:hypothetical protein
LGGLSVFFRLPILSSKADPLVSSKDPSRHRQDGRPASQNHQSAPSTKPAEAALSSGNAADKEYAFQQLLPQLMVRDIAAAAKMAENLKPWAWREEVLFQVAQEWARQDPAAASAWAKQLPDATERTNVFNHVCIATAKNDPIRALDLAKSDRPLQERILQILASRDSQAAIHWAETIADSEIRQSAFARIALGHAETSPQEAARLVAEHLTSSPLQDETALAVLHQWILRDPGGARAWVEIFPDGPLLEIAESELAAAAAYPISQ